MVVERAPGGGGGWSTEIDGARAFAFGNQDVAVGRVLGELILRRAGIPELQRVRALVVKELKSRRRVEVTAEVRGAAVRHIRKTDASVKDRRFRSGSKYANAPRPVFCGADPSDTDVSLGDARRLLSPDTVALRPDWSADLCPSCRAALASVQS